jgi:DNA primase large subunit
MGECLEMVCIDIKEFDRESFTETIQTWKNSNVDFDRVIFGKINKKKESMLENSVSFASFINDA